jgi:hypothetical protein
MSVNYMTGEKCQSLEDDISTDVLYESIKDHLKFNHKFRNLSPEDYQSRIKKIADALDI